MQDAAALSHLLIIAELRHSWILDSTGPGTPTQMNKFADLDKAASSALAGLQPKSCQQLCQL